MSNLLFDRKAKVNIGSQEYSLDDFTIEFDIPYSISDEPDIAEIAIYNISDTSINSIVSNTKIVVTAGYGNNVGTIFDGRVEQVLPEWSGVDKKVVILASEVGNKLRTKKIKKTYKANTKTDFIIRDIARQIGLKVGDVTPTRNINQGKGRTVDGIGYTEIRKLAHESNSKVFIKNGKLYVRPAGKTDKSGVVLNEKSGLIGSPTREEREEEVNGQTKKIVEYNLTSLLNHEIQKDSTVKVESRQLNGFFNVIEVHHTTDFKTDIKVRG